MPIRFATPADSRELLKIYAQYIDTPITFEYTLPAEQEFANRISGISESYPYILCEENNKIAGYAYACRYRAREAYQWDAEASVYIDRDCTSKGLGKTLYRILIELLRLQGVKTVYGGVVTPNVKSEALHKSLGFQILGIARNTGYKNGEWHDVAWFQKQIAEYDSPPRPVVPVNKLHREQVGEILLSAV